MIDEYIERTTNPRTFVSDIEACHIPYNRLEIYHKAHNKNKFRPIDYFFLSMYSRDKSISAHAQAVLFCLERGESLERTMERIWKRMAR